MQQPVGGLDVSVALGRLQSTFGGEKAMNELSATHSASASTFAGDAAMRPASAPNRPSGDLWESAKSVGGRDDNRTVTIDVRPQRTDDRDAVRTVLTEAFADGGDVADLAEALRARVDTQAALVAVDGDLVVGHTQLSIGWVDAPSRLVEVLVLSPLGVLPSHQSQGLGRRLVGEAIGTAQVMGSPLLFLEGDPGYYARLGWRAAGELGFLQPSVRIPDVAFQVVTLPTYDPAVMRGALVYNDTFWSHDCVGLRN